jgi:hypothetical protein
MFAGHFDITPDPSLPVNALLVPLFTLAALQYALNTITTAWFLSFDAGKLKLIPSADTVVWTLTTQLAGAASAVLFYSAVQNRVISYGLLGLLITSLVHLLYRFNEGRLEDVKAAEAIRRQHIE